MASNLEVGSVKTVGNIHMDAAQPVLNLDGAGAAAVSSAIYFTEAGHDAPPTAGSYAGSIEYDGVVNQITIGGYVNAVASPAMKIPRGGGAVSFVDGVNVLSGGVAFPATQSASAGSNTLDDYEEGTWTPALKFGGNSVSMTYSIQSGAYTKIGNRVLYSFFFVLTAKGSSTGAVFIEDLPFAVPAGYLGYSATSLRLQNISFADTPSGATVANTTSLDLRETSNAGVQSTLTESNFADDSYVIGSGQYRI